MEIGEPVDPPEFVSSDRDLHDENTCPWCQPKEKQGASEKMVVEDPPDDVVGAIPPNDGGKLGRNMRNAGNPEPELTVTLVYRKGSVIRFESGRKAKVFPVYQSTPSDDTEDYEVQFAPHHLIPGNASLKGSVVVPFMGDADSISEYAKGQASKIKKGGFVGYDINSAANGEWLPSPYALSMRNDWPAERDVEVLKKRSGLDFGEVTEAFKAAYVAAAIEGSGRQFHMSHAKYSKKVQAILRAVGERLALMSMNAICPVAKAGKSENGMFEPPYGLVARLNVLSNNLRRLTTGGTWRPPLYADRRTEEYAKDLAEAKAEFVVERVI
jgi:hypothetical protein